MSRVLKPSHTAGIAFLALLVALSGSSYAAPVREAASKLITGKQVKKNTLTGAHVKNGSLTAADIKGGAPAGPRGAAGPAGPAGPQGPQGARGANGANGTDAVSLWASVTSAGAVDKGRGVVSAQNDPLNDGEFEVKFNRNIRGCSYQATQVDNFGDYAPGRIQVSEDLYMGTAKPNDEVSVSTRDAAGNRADRQFHIAVYC